MIPDYFLLVFIAAMGVYQIAAVHAGLRGLCFFKQPIVQSFFGAAAIVAAFAWFYTKEDRNVQHNVEGAQQLIFFLAAAILAYLVTVGLASIINARASSVPGDNPRQHPADLGIEALKAATLFQAVIARCRNSGRRDD